MSKTELDLMKCKELREVAKDLDISGRWDMTKEQLIEAILGAKNVEVNEKVIAKDEEKIDNQNVEVDIKNEKESTDIQIDMDQKMKYIEEAKVGLLVAFKLPNGKVKTAKIVNKSTKNKKLKLETEYGAEFIVPYVDVLWIKTGKRWPKGVYKILKGENNAGKGEEIKG